MAKVLFVKVFAERELARKRIRDNRFTVQRLKEQFGDNPLNVLFQQTKLAYVADQLFEPNDEIKLKPETAEAIVLELQGVNLSATGDDIKGIAFERFLGQTYRGELGQFFTPRPVVEFMIRMIEPKEGEIICDPCSGSGGFLIRFFEIVRQIILTDADAQYTREKTAIEADTDLNDTERAKKLRAAYEAIQSSIDRTHENSRMWKLSNRAIYGTDANGRLARTCKMNMILHGDGHGGIHHHNGFLNVNGIFEERFDIILTNPPFGAKVEASHKVEMTDPTPEAARRYTDEYGDLYRDSQARVTKSLNEPIATLFTLPKIEKKSDGSYKGATDTEILFIERCLALLKPGGRLGIVLPEGIFNNPSLAYVREYAEDVAQIVAVVSLPADTFKASQASVKASLLFLRKRTESEIALYNVAKSDARFDAQNKYLPEITAEQTRLRAEIETAKTAKDGVARKACESELRAYENRMERQIATEARAFL